jgi:hypothetical protein
MLEPPTLHNGTTSIYALGLYVHRYRGAKVIHHPGGVIGGNSQMLVAPEHGLAIAMMVNSSLVDATTCGWKILDVLLDKHLGPPRTQLSCDEFAHLDGAHYHGSSGTLLGFGRVAGGRLGLSINGLPALPLLWDRGDSVGPGFDDLTLGPIRFSRRELENADGGPPDQLSVEQSGFTETLHYGDANQASPGSAKALLGRYASNDLAATATAELVGDVVMLTLRGNVGPARRFKVIPLSDHVFRLEDPDAPIPAYVLITDGQPEPRHFKLDHIRARHVAFDRME